MRRLITYLLLTCATVHCILAVFYDNYSYLNLHAYATGTASLPFQRRLLMIPLLRWAESNQLLQRMAVRYGMHTPLTEPMSAAKLFCIILGIVLILGLGLWTTYYARRLSVRRWWLIWALLLVILYVSYAARYEQALWYPYDLPHLVLFGLATVFILSNRPILFLLCVIPDVFVRETSLFAVLLALFVHYRSTVWRIVGAAGLVLWGLSRLLARELYPHNPYAWSAIPWHRMLMPWHIPQVLSIVGFFWIPVWLAKRFLSDLQRRALYGATALMLYAFYFANWMETRVWSEWSLLFAVLAAVEFERAFASPCPDSDAPIPARTPIEAAATPQP